jgi:uncharacterized membrane protein
LDENILHAAVTKAIGRATEMQRRYKRARWRNAMNGKTLSSALAASVAAALMAAYAMPASAAAPEGKESCYGVSLKGHNDCAAGNHSCAGQSSASYRASDFKYVAAGTCASMKVHGHKGSLTPA